MNENQQILRLLENALDTGASPEELCTDFPGLLPRLRAQLNQCRRIDAQIDSLFSPSSISDVGSARSLSEPELPQIPGYCAFAVLGRGGMGIVYRARQVDLNRNIALKMLLAGEFAGAVERTRFLREARAVGSLLHSNIVQVHDVGECEGRPFFTMELVEGGTLAERLNGIPQPTANALAMMITLADAVGYAHQKGIVHRDLKPTNVLLTSGGTLKISDFGLARRLDGDGGLTVSGVRMGTPNYMAPEQSLGAQSVGPQADVYSLGAILYEMLTGRPPFRGESAVETERQLQSTDPVPPSKLNARVPRDLETICLMCLRKDPLRRYSTATALAEDLGHAQRNEPIIARQTGAIERFSKWAARHPAKLTAYMSAALLAAVLVTAITWFASQRSANNKLAESHLRDAIRFQQQSRWKEADTSIEQATALLGDHGSRDMHQQLDLARHDSELAAQLEAIHLDQAGFVDGLIDFKLSSQKYRDAFQTASLGQVADHPEQVAQRIHDSHICNELVSAIYDWMLWADRPTQRSLLIIARRVDRDPTGARDRVLEPTTWTSAQTLPTLANDLIVTDHSVSFLMAVSHQLASLNQETIPFLKKVQEAYPQDFWANLMLAHELWIKGNAAESIRFFQAAIAIRPDVAVSYDGLGAAFSQLHRSDESLAAIGHAIMINPQTQTFRDNFADEMFNGNRFAEAIPLLQGRLGKSNYEAKIREMLGQSLENVGRIDEALTLYREWTKSRPRDLKVQKQLQIALLKLGRDDEALVAWQASIVANPRTHAALDGLAEYYLYHGRAAAYQSTCSQLLSEYGDNRDPVISERVAKTCLLMPDADDRIRRATALIDKAIKQDQLKPTALGPYLQFSKALSDYRDGNYVAATSILNGKAAKVLGPAPTLVLAMCECRLGESDQARKSLARATTSYNWKFDPFTSAYWTYLILRHEAEATILPAK